METSQKPKIGVILQPGAIGDCVLTLPLAKFMKESLKLDAIHIIGHSEYAGILPTRTCIDAAISIDSLELHRLFTDEKKFFPADKDPLIKVFEKYDWIITFLGEPNSSFEKNLIFTAYCTHSTEVITLQMKPAEELSLHLTQFYIKQFVNQCHIPLTYDQPQPSRHLIKATEADVNKGRELLKKLNVGCPEKLVVIHPGSGGKHKCWHIENFLAIAKELSSGKAHVVFLLGPAELERFSDAAVQNITRTAECLRDLPLTDVLGLLGCCAAYLGNDSGITHLAASLGIKTLVVFGPTNPAVYGPIGSDVTVIADKRKAFGNKPSKKLQKEVLNVFSKLFHQE